MQAFYHPCLLYSIFYFTSEINVIELSFTIIKDYENIADEINNKVNKIKSPTVYPWYIWNFCMRQIVFKLEDRVQSIQVFLKIFLRNFMSLSTLLVSPLSWGKTYQREKAKEWVSLLEEIMSDKRIDPMIKIQFITEHLRKPEEEKIFSNLKNIHDDFGFCCDFEHERTRIMRMVAKASSTITSIRQAINV